MGWDADQRELLESVLLRRCPELVFAVSLDGRRLPPGVQQRIEDAIFGELRDEGLRPDDEPNPYGLRLDALLGWVIKDFTGSYD